MIVKGSYKRFSIIFAVIWIFLTLYPNPAALSLSLYRVFDPPVNPSAVDNILPELPNPSDPSSIEKYILAEFPYKHDWKVYNYPWYYPTTEEALQKDKGDCKTRFIIIASIFESLSIPYELFASPSHIWIHYAGKRETEIENQQVAMFQYDGKEFAIQLPQRFNILRNLENFWKAFFAPMPIHRQKLLLTGLGISVLLFNLPPPGDSLAPTPRAYKRRK